MARAAFVSTRRPDTRVWLAVALGCLALSSGTGCLTQMPRTLTVWIVSGDDELTHDTPPNLENDVYSAARGGLRLSAALNETAAFQVALQTAAPPAGPFDIRISDLAGPRETLAARAAVSVYRAHDARVGRFRSWYPAHTGRPATPTVFPDILVPWDAPRGGGPLILGEKRNEIIWVDIHVPPTLAPGEYRGRVEVRTRGQVAPAFTCDLQLEVLPVALPARPSLPLVCRVDPRDLLAAHLRWPATATAEETTLLPDMPSHFAAVRLVRETMRLLHEHRTTPVLWASFPKFLPTSDRSVEVNWDEYDQLVSGWLDGSAFPDRTRLELWPIPAAIAYPDAERNGGLDSPQYARLLSTYLAECKRHFAARGWLDRAFLRLSPPEPLGQTAVDRVRRLAGILRQSEAGLPLVAHLPARSLRGLGWHAAPTIELTDVSKWAPPAMWFEPEGMERERKAGRDTWFMPDQPPYSGSLAVEALATDAQVLPWQAYRYEASAIWVEHAAEFASAPEATGLQPWGSVGLVYPAEQYGLRDQPVPSRRLKRLQRGLQDYELLRLLEVNGKQLLARKLAEQVVRWAGTDACVGNLLTCKGDGWPRDAGIFRLARTLMLRELVLEFAPSAAAGRNQIGTLSNWALLMNQAQRVAVGVDGVRLTPSTTGLRAQVLGSLLNMTDRPLQGRWTLPLPPAGWQQAGEVVTSLPPGTRRPARLDLNLSGLAFNVDGVYPFDVELDTAALGAFRTPARLAVAVCPHFDAPRVVDGSLRDWPLASNNAAGDFRLCAGPGPEGPTLPTQAFFCMDDECLYVAIRCGLLAGEPPLWQADNVIPFDGAIPWGQDVVEVLLDPRPTAEGSSSDLYCLQVKPSGLLVARKGCRTEPPMGTSDDWRSGARVAVSVQRDAWVIELGIPLSALPPEAKRNRVWGFNVTRLDARRGEYSSWSGARGHCYAPQALGNLIMLWP